VVVENIYIHVCHPVNNNSIFDSIDSNWYPQPEI